MGSAARPSVTRAVVAQRHFIAASEHRQKSNEDEKGA